MSGRYVSFEPLHALRNYEYYYSQCGELVKPKWRKDPAKIKLYAIPHYYPGRTDMWAFVVTYDMKITDVKEPHIAEDLHRAIEVTPAQLRDWSAKKYGEWKL